MARNTLNVGSNPTIVKYAFVAQLVERLTVAQKVAGSIPAIAPYKEGKMTAREFLQNFIEALPSRGLDNTEVHIESWKNEYEVENYRILKISNDDSNDSIFITIAK